MPTRREVLGTLAAGALPLLGAQHGHDAGPLVKQALPEPRVFSSGEFRLLSRVVDLIIPPTDTPGAAEAGVAHWIDADMAGSKGERVNVLSQGLAALNRAARERGGKTFLALDEAGQVEILTLISGQPDTPAGRFFALVKDLTIDIYYTTRVGLVDELGYHGNTYLAEFKGCTHPEHQG